MKPVLRGEKSAQRSEVEYMLAVIPATTLADESFRRAEYDFVRSGIGDNRSFADVEPELLASRGKFAYTMRVPLFFQAIMDRDCKTNRRDSLNAILAVYATCVALTVADGRTSTSETRAYLDSYLKPLARAVIDAGIASRDGPDA